jgi:hypothetical protein
METSGLLLWRKMSTSFSDQLLAAPATRATDEEFETFLSEYRILSEKTKQLDNMQESETSGDTEEKGKEPAEEAPAKEPISASALRASLLSMAEFAVSLENP